MLEGFFHAVAQDCPLPEEPTALSTYQLAANDVLANIKRLNNAIINFFILFRLIPLR
jgi:hypothetical protein